MLVQGLASPGPAAYDTLQLRSYRWESNFAQAYVRRETPMMGKPRRPSARVGRYHEDEVRYVSRRIAAPPALTPAAYTLPSTFVAEPRPPRPRPQIQRHTLRHTPKEAERAGAGAGAPRPRPRSAAAAWPPTALEQPIVGSERRRIRPASASTVRQYSSYSTQLETRPPSFPRPPLKPPPSTPAEEQPSAQPVKNRRPMSARAGPAAAAPSAGADGRSPARRPRPRSATAAPASYWRVASIGGYGTSSTVIGPPPRVHGEVHPLRSAFVQPYGPNKNGV